MITADEARKLEGVVSSLTISLFIGKIKRRSRYGHKTATVDFLSGSDIDKLSDNIMKQLEEWGFKCEYVIKKRFFVDWGFREIEISWEENLCQ